MRPHGSPGDASPALADYESLRADLARAVGQVCPRWLSDRAEDLVQVALMRVLDVQRKSEDREGFSTFYLRKAAYSALVDEIRRLRRRREVPLSEEISQISEAGPDPERHSTGRETGRAIRRCLERMIRPRRQAVTLHLQGHSVPELGQLLGWNPKKAENLVYRGMADLRACLAAMGMGR